MRLLALSLFSSFLHSLLMQRYRGSRGSSHRHVAHDVCRQLSLDSWPSYLLWSFSAVHVSTRQVLCMLLLVISIVQDNHVAFETIDRVAT